MYVRTYVCMYVDQCVMTYDAYVYTDENLRFFNTSALFASQLLVDAHLDIAH